MANLKIGDPGYGKVCPQCGEGKAAQAHRCMTCARPRRDKAEIWQAYYEKHGVQLRAASNERHRSLSIEVKARYALRHREWRKENPEKVKAYTRQANRRRRRLDKISEEYAQVLYRDPCCYCGRRTEHVDHVQPLIADGGNDWTNLTGACARCNHAKSARSLLTFLLAERTREESCTPSTS